MTLMGRSWCLTYGTFVYLQLPDESGTGRRNLMICPVSVFFLAHFFSKLLCCFWRLNGWLLRQRNVQHYGTMVLTLQRKCGPAPIEGRCCWETCCRPPEWNLLVGWNHSAADKSTNGHILYTCVSCVRLHRRNQKFLEGNWLAQAVNPVTRHCARS